MIFEAPLSLERKRERAAKIAPYEEQLRRLRREAKGAHAALTRLWDERRELLHEVQTLRAWLGTATYVRAINPPKRDDTPQIAGVKLDLEYAEKRLAELDAAIAEAQAAWRPQSQLISRSEEWLQANTSRLCEYG
ncbi:MAG: hypothetical protein KFB96_13385 [Thiocapsa sp.]|uniref:hypothetical protein n=1 Tax=Thiocapsa sp. TaxID=2024551 RepID=UPI001BCB07EE|nr:hypothetical protein [Thiocapsa sp.]QVL46758.1 MAG: hypothetical protein KFB96_13385 [Thiocapsa sp.]